MQRREVDPRGGALGNNDDPDTPHDFLLKQAIDLAQPPTDLVAVVRRTDPSGRYEADPSQLGGRGIGKAKDRYPKVTALSRLAALSDGGKFVTPLQSSGPSKSQRAGIRQRCGA